ncbi:MAG TPA: TetR/AcrR family transcriptional regulator [Conexibacter sp.]
MPRNRRHVERDEKVAAILDAGELRLRADGVAGFSVAALARDLGLAGNAIYWYFPTRDDLLIATVEHLLHGIVARKPPGRGDLAARVLWFVEQLDALEHVRVGLSERARVSPVVADFLARLDDQGRSMLRNVLAGHVPQRDLGVAAQTLLATIDGLRLHALTRAERRRIVRYALARVTGPS